MFSNYEFPAFNREAFESREAPEPIFHYAEEIPPKPALHSFVGKLALPATGTYKDNEATYRREFAARVKELNKKKYKTVRKSVEVNGNKVDMVFLGKKKSLKKNGRWILFSLPNNACFENELTYSSTLRKLKKLDANAVFFNYPSVGCSEGEANQGAMVAAYHAMLKLLEDKVEAKQIIMIGTSIGGGVEGTALRDYEFKMGVTYLSVIEQSFSNINLVTDDLLQEASPALNLFVPNAISKLASTSLKKAGWSLESLTSAHQLENKEIRQVIIQNSRIRNARVCHAHEIVGDGIISAETSYAKAILSQEDRQWQTKRIVGVTAPHVRDYETEEEDMIMEAIKEELEFSLPFGWEWDLAERQSIDRDMDTEDTDSVGSIDSSTTFSPSGSSSSSSSSSQTYLEDDIQFLNGDEIFFKDEPSR